MGFPFGTSKEKSLIVQEQELQLEVKDITFRFLLVFFKK